MLTVGNRDCHLSRNPCQLASAGVGDDRDGQVRNTLVHGSTVLQHEAAAVAVQGSSDFFNGHVGARALGGGASGEHLALAGGFEITMVLLVERHPAEKRVVGFLIRGDRKSTRLN